MLPNRVQAELQAAEALEAADQAARAQVPARAIAAADLVAPPPAAAPALAPVPAPAPAAPAQKDDFEHKYRVLQGMYAADVKTLQANLKALNERVQGLTSPPPAPPAPVVDPRDIAKDVEAFGADMMDMVQRYVTSAVTTLSGRIQALEQALNGVTQDTAQTKEQQFYALLDKLVPTWRAVNAEPRWLEWLGAVDEVYGLARQSALDNAFNRLDAQQVAKVFNAFIASTPPAPVPPSLDSQITPEGSGNTEPPAQETKPILSEKAITAFYNDRSRGAYAGREAEAADIEAQIDIAVAEGRVGR